MSDVADIRKHLDNLRAGTYAFKVLPDNQMKKIRELIDMSEVALSGDDKAATAAIGKAKKFLNEVIADIPAEQRKEIVDMLESDSAGGDTSSTIHAGYAHAVRRSLVNNKNR